MVAIWLSINLSLSLRLPTVQFSPDTFVDSINSLRTQHQVIMLASTTQFWSSTLILSYATIILLDLFNQITFAKVWTLLYFSSVCDSGHFSQAGGNCWSNRANVGENDFVPECTETGNYKVGKSDCSVSSLIDLNRSQPVQCDKKTGYCFCMDELTGRVTSNTTVFLPPSHPCHLLWPHWTLSF